MEFEKRETKMGHALVPALPVGTKCLQPRHQMGFVARERELVFPAHIREDTVRLAIPGTWNVRGKEGEKRKRKMEGRRTEKNRHSHVHVAHLLLAIRSNGSWERQPSLMRIRAIRV
jgi:hypothetical protein